jgi:hypothetical protein
MTQSGIEFNLVHVGGDVWEVYFDGKKLMTGSAASCKDLLEAFAEVSRRSSRPILEAFGFGVCMGAKYAGEA